MKRDGGHGLRPPADEDGATLGEILRATRKRLAEAAIDDPGLEARILVEHLAGIDRQDIFRRPESAVSGTVVSAIQDATGRRLAGEPVYRILGFREFRGLTLKLSPETLEPRPDTETLVDLVLPHLRGAARRHGVCRVLDLGTGTGAIALAILAEMPEAEAVGVDISAGALATAAQNARENGLSDRFSTMQSNWLEKIDDRFHAIVSNPPYIRREEIAGLDIAVRGFDPLVALDGGEDGLDAYRVIAGSARRNLAEGGIVAVEIGHDQRGDVGDVFRQAGYRLLAEAKDLGGNDRTMIFVPETP